MRVRRNELPAPAHPRRRCCICGDLDVTREMGWGRIGDLVHRSTRYYCESCWGVLRQWFGAQIALMDADEAAERARAGSPP
jgi:hypothetical protein